MIQGKKLGKDMARHNFFERQGDFFVRAKKWGEVANVTMHDAAYIGLS